MSEFTYKDIVDKKVYTYNEDKYLKELQDYILNTYKQHYSKNKFKPNEIHYKTVWNSVENQMKINNKKIWFKDN